MCLCSLETAWPLCHEFWGVLLLLLVGALSSTASSRGHHFDHPKLPSFWRIALWCILWWSMVKKIGKYGLGPGKRSSFCQILNPDKMFPFCMLYSDCQQDYLLRSWKNSRWTNKTWSESFSNEHRIPDCFNMFQQTSTTYKMFSQHVGGRSPINMVSWHREIASWNPHKETSAVTGWRKKLEKMPSCRLFNN